MRDCPQCLGALETSEQSCIRCGLALRGRFPRSRLARLSREEQQLAEALLLASGNLKQLERELGLSYPTVRKRVAGLRDTLEQLREDDRATTATWLEQVESGELHAEEAARYIDCLNGAH